MSSLKEKYNILGVILARGGSKGVPKKNIRPLNGVPLIGYTICEGLRSNYLQTLVVSTESEEIKDVALTYGAEVPFLRPLELASDTARSNDAVEYTVDRLEKETGVKYDFVVEMLITNPMKTSEDIDGVIEKLIETKADSVIGVTKLEDHHPIRIKKIVDDRIVDFCLKEVAGSRRQDLKPDAYIRNGSIYACKRACIQTRVGCENSRPFIMPDERSANIDAMNDFILAETLVKLFPRDYIKPVVVLQNSKTTKLEAGGNERVVKKIAVIGLGGMGRRHCEAVGMLDYAKLSAVCDISDEALARAQKDYGAENIYKDWKEMLDKESLDLLVVATNGDTHAEMTIFAAEKGIKRIICEKPMTTSLIEAQRMVDVCREHNVRLAVNHLRRWVPAYQRLKEMISKGVIGEVRHITFEMAGGQMGSNGGHFWDLVRFLTGQEFVKAQGFLDKTGTPNPRGSQYQDPGAYGLLWLENNARVFFDMSEDYGVPFFLEIMGSVGRITVDEKACDWRIQARTQEERDQPMTRRPSLVNVAFEGEAINMVVGCRNIMDNLFSEEPILCDGEDGIRSLMTTVAVHQSDQEGNKIIEVKANEEYAKKVFQFT